MRRMREIFNLFRNFSFMNCSILEFQTMQRDAGIRTFNEIIRDKERSLFPKMTTRFMVRARDKQNLPRYEGPTWPSNRRQISVA